MNLNQDCVRDILLCMEALEYNQYLTLNNSTKYESLSKYSPEEIQYSVEKLKEADYINAEIIRSLGGGFDFLAKSITWTGHQFLDNIKDKTIWASTKNTVSKIASVSLPILNEVAKSILLKKLGLQ